MPGCESLAPRRKAAKTLSWRGTVALDSPAGFHHKGRWGSGSRRTLYEPALLSRIHRDGEEVGGRDAAPRRPVGAARQVCQALCNRHRRIFPHFPRLTCGARKFRLGQMLAVEPMLVAAPAESPPPKPAPGWKEIAQSVEPFLQAVGQRLLAQTGEFEPQIAAYAQYALAAQGKQLRPMLVALSGEACGGLNDSHLTVAVIIEMVHLATLVHDDIIDEADLRRGRPSLAANWGTEVSVLLGDCLFAHSLKLAAGFPTPEICREVASATKTVCAGEILQSRSRGHSRWPAATTSKCWP